MSKVVSYPARNDPTSRSGGGSSLRHLAKHARLRDVRHVDEDVVRRVTVQRRAEALLVEVVANETDAAAEDEQTVESANLEIDRYQ